MCLNEIQVRAATNQDIPFIKKVVFSSLREFGLSPDENGKDKDLNDIESSYMSNNGFFGVVVHSETNAIVGCFGLFPVNDFTCELRKMYLLKESRGKGMGKLILDTAIRIAREKYYKKIILETISVLATAIALYKRYGFIEIKPKEISARVDQSFELTIDP
ncbi:MAG TPA: GNAT family N-acetyltransferase [Puia sp.]|nr:GNAT family N-acetyltransferase [Puia sp.]